MIINRVRRKESAVDRISSVSLSFADSEQALFLIKSVIFLFVCGVILFFALGTSYPAIHDTVHNLRHALAIVPCH